MSPASTSTATLQHWEGDPKPALSGRCSGRSLSYRLRRGAGVCLPPRLTPRGLTKMTTDTATVIPMLNVMAQRIRVAYERAERGRQEWIEGTLELSVALAETRARFPADRDFSRWLSDNELDKIGRDDRAALIAMADDLEIFRGVLIEQTDMLHADTLWRKYQNRFRKLPKPEAAPEIAQNPPRQPAIPTKTEIEAHETPSGPLLPASDERGREVRPEAEALRLSAQGSPPAPRQW
jgi:hypothetical protein